MVHILRITIWKISGPYIRTAVMLILLMVVNSKVKRNSVNSANKEI